MAEKEKDKAGGERWKAAIVNLSEMSENLDSLQRILAKKSVFVDDDTFSKASLIAEQARNIKSSGRSMVESSNSNNTERNGTIIFIMANIKNIANVVLTTDNYAIWSMQIIKQIIKLFTTNGFHKFLDGSVPSPPQTCVNTKALEQRVGTLERELDAAIAAAARARSEKRQAEAAQRAAELHTQDVNRELENTTKVFELHMEELRRKQEEISKKDSDIKVLEAIIQTLSRNGSSASED